jgi:peptide/nickel transport system permease protein
MGLGAYLVRRLLLVIPTLLGVSLLVFAVTMFFGPEQRANLYVRDPKMVDLETIVKAHNLDAPAYVQYFGWFSEVLTGNLGYSQTARMPVVTAILKKVPATAEIVMFSIPLTVLLGIWLGIQSAVHRDTIVDHLTRLASIVGWSLPSFWLGIVLLSIFFMGLGVFPPERLGTNTQSFVDSSGQFIKYTGLNTIDGILNGQLWVTWDALQHLVLPTITLTTIQIALIVRVMRSSMLEALGKGYVTTARAKGLSKKEVINKHARRNALIPVITLSGLLAAGMLNGVVITETIFNIQGVGRFGANAALVGPDVPAVLGFALFSGILFVVANLLVDLLYAYTDPRIRLG